MSVVIRWCMCGFLKLARAGHLRGAGGLGAGACAGVCVGRRGRAVVAKPHLVGIMLVADCLGRNLISCCRCAEAALLVAG